MSDRDERLAEIYTPGPVDRALSRWTQWVNTSALRGKQGRLLAAALAWLVVVVATSWWATDSRTGVVVLAALAAVGTTSLLARSHAYRAGWMDGRRASREAYLEAKREGRTSQEWLFAETMRDARDMLGGVE